MKHVGIVHETGSLWRSLNDDPQFAVRFPFFRPRYCAFFLQALDGPLDPVIYYDRGYGPNEGDSLCLEHSGSALYVVSLRQAGDIKRIRFDPATRPAKFRFWAETIYREDTLARVLARAAEDARASGHPLQPHIRISPPRKETVKRVAGARVARSVVEHYRHVLKLAATSVSASSPEPGGGSVLSFSFVVPTYNTKPQYLRDLIKSFLAQPSIAAELVLADDGSTLPETLKALRDASIISGITYVPNAENTGIAATINRGLDAARGNWVGFVDHDDALTPHALGPVVAAMRQHPDASFFYTDEVIADLRLKPVGYLLKPAFDPVLLSGVNYVNHLSLFRRDRLIRIGGLREGFEGSQDYDLLLRYLEGVPPAEIVHIPFPAYLWRRGPDTYSTIFRDRAIASARRALAERYHTTHPSISVESALDDTLHRPRFDKAMNRWPRITVVIPSRDALDLVSRVLHDLHTRTDYPDLEVIVVDNGSTDPQVLQLYESYSAASPNFRAIVITEDFNFARQVNRGIRASTGEHVLLLNNDIEVLTDDWLREMVSCLSYPNAGIVGAMLLYPDHKIQHAGVIVGFGGLAGHWYERKPENFPGAFGRLRVRQSLSAVTGACMLISRECIDRVGEFDERRFAVAYNDVDFCLRAASKGLRTVWTPFAILVHHESASRGSDELARNRERFAREKAALQELHKTAAFVDPSLNPWHTRDRSDPALALLSELPAPKAASIG